MRQPVVVIGGHTRNIGKTSTVCELIAGLPEWQWTAIKITQFGHGVCSANGEPCDCAGGDHPQAISLERERGSGTDTSRYLDAGATRSYWVRTQQGELFQAMPKVRSLLQSSAAAVIESNSVLRFLVPDVYLAVLDGRNEDIKPSSTRFLDRAHALLVPEDADPQQPAFRRVMASRPVFRFKAPVYFPAEALHFVQVKLKEKPGS